MIVVASWTYVGSGYETEGRRWLAASAAARAREERRIAREELDHDDRIRRCCMTLRRRRTDRVGWAADCATGPPTAWARRCGSCAGWFRAPHRLRQARPPRPHRRPRPGRLHRRRPGRCRPAAELAAGGIAVAHIERRVRNGKTTYRARYRDPAGREHAKVFARKADAQRFLTEMENSKLKGTWTNPALGRVLFREWFAEWQRTTARPRPNTEARDEWLLQASRPPPLRPIPLAGPGQRDVRAWVARLIAKELAASTVQRCYQLLSKVMAAAVDAGMIRRHRAGGCRCPRSSAKRCGSSPPLRSGSWPTRSGPAPGADPARGLRGAWRRG